MHFKSFDKTLFSKDCSNFLKHVRNFNFTIQAKLNESFVDGYYKDIYFVFTSDIISLNPNLLPEIPKEVPQHIHKYQEKEKLYKKMKCKDAHTPAQKGPLSWHCTLNCHLQSQQSI